MTDGKVYNIHILVWAIRRALISISISPMYHRTYLKCYCGAHSDVMRVWKIDEII